LLFLDFNEFIDILNDDVSERKLPPSIFLIELSDVAEYISEFKCLDDFLEEYITEDVSEKKPAPCCSVAFNVDEASVGTSATFDSGSFFNTVFGSATAVALEATPIGSAFLINTGLISLTSETLTSSPFLFLKFDINDGLKF